MKNQSNYTASETRRKSCLKIKQFSPRKAKIKEWKRSKWKYRATPVQVNVVIMFKLACLIWYLFKIWVNLTLVLLHQRLESVWRGHEGTFDLSAIQNGCQASVLFNSQWVTPFSIALAYAACVLMRLLLKCSCCQCVETVRRGTLVPQASIRT